VCIRGGNFVPVEHGDTQDPVDLATPAADVRYWPKLPKRDPTFSLGDYTPGGPSAKAMLFPPAAVAEPRLSLREARSRGGRKWLARTSLFESGPLDPHYVVEVESSREARLRFGDGVNGMEPPLDAGFRVEQCTGNGTIGNVGPNAIVHIVLPREARTSVRAVRNPSGAFGGTDPEALSSVRLNAPAAFRTTERVVSPGDYEREARKVDGVVDATAVISNTGSWPIALVYVHSRDWSEDDALITPVERRLKPRQPAGVDLEVRRAVPMPVTAALDVTLASGWDMTGTSELVDSAIRGAFLDSARFGFGTAIHRSELVTVMGRLPGIADVWVRELRWTGQPPGEPAAESLLPPLGHVVRIENSPRHPERGTITYEMRVAAP
jgi:predicted phage baseplate assembly protein